MATLGKFTYELTQSVSNSFQENDTIEFTFQAAGTSNLSRNAEQKVDLWYSLNSESLSWVNVADYPKNFGVGTSYATKSFSTSITGDWQAVKAIITGSVYTASDDTGIGVTSELNVDYDSLQITSYTPKSELTDKGLLVFRSPSRYIKADTNGVEIKGGVIQTEKLIAEELEVFGDVTIFGDFQASPIPPYAGGMIDIKSGSGANGTSVDYARGDHTHEMTFEIVDNLLSNQVFTNNISSSGFISTNSHITASGNISASGTIIGGDISSSGNISSDGTGSFEHLIVNADSGVPTNHKIVQIQKAGSDLVTIDEDGDTIIGGVVVVQGDYVYNDGNQNFGVFGANDLVLGMDWNDSAVSSAIRFTQNEFSKTPSNTLMIISSSGNVGIGKTDPVHKLDIKGASPLIGFYGSSDEYRALIGTGGSVITGAGLNDFGIRAGQSDGNVLFSAGGTTEMMRISASGDVGIGTTSPAHLLHLSSSTETIISIDSSADNKRAGIRFNTKRPGTGMGSSYLYKSGSQMYSDNDEGFHFRHNGKETIQLSNYGIDIYSASVADGVPTDQWFKADITTKRVGIGTTAPYNPLQVNSPDKHTPSIVAGYDNGANGKTAFAIEYNQEAGNFANTLGNQYSSNYWVIGYNVKPDSGSNDAFVSSMDNGASTKGVLEVGNELQFLNAGSSTTTLNTPVSMTSRFIIKSDGNVGIGVTDPDRPLEVVSSAEYLAKFYSTDDTAIVEVRDDNTVTHIVAKDNVMSLGGSASLSPHNLNIMTTTGNVGIGTTDPDALLHIGKGSVNRDTLIKLESSYVSDGSSVGGIQWADNSNVTANISTRYDGSKVSMYFGSLYNSGYNSTERMVIQGDGNVGIGTTSPTKELQVAGDISASGDYYVEATNKIYFGTGANTYLQESGNDTLVFYAGGNLKLVLDDNNNSYFPSSGGNVGIGTTSPLSNLHIKKDDHASFRIDSSGGTDKDTTIRFSGSAQTWDVKQYAQGSVSDGQYGFHIVDITNSKFPFSIQPNNASKTLVLSGSRVGIGTSSPDSLLTLSQSGAGSTTTILNVGGAENGRMLVRHIDGKSSTSNDLHNLYLNYQSSGNVNMVNGGGKVGIGANRGAPSESLDVNGNIRLSGGHIFFSHDGPTNSNNEYIQTGDSNWGTSSKQAGGSFSFHADSNRTETTASATAALFCKGLWSQGAIGIGTDTSPNWVGDGTNTPPNVMMEVDGDVIVQKGHYMTYDNSYYNHGYHRVDNTTSQLHHYGYYGQVFGTNQNTNNLFISHSGAYSRIGIGTGTPDATLKIVDASTSAVNSLNLNNRVKFRGDGVITWGSVAEYGILSWDTGVAKVGAQSGKRLDLIADNTAVMTVTSSAATKVIITGGGDGQAFGGKTVEITEVWTTILTVSMADNESAYIKLAMNGFWSNHSGLMFMAEYFLSNGAGSYNEPGMILRQVDNTGGIDPDRQGDTIRTKLVSSGDTIQIQAVIVEKTKNQTETVDAKINFHIMGEFDTIA